MFDFVNLTSVKIDDHAELTTVDCPRGAYNLSDARLASNPLLLGDKIHGSITVGVDIRTTQQYIDQGEPSVAGLSSDGNFYLQVRTQTGKVLFSTLVVKPTVKVNVPVASLVVGHSIGVSYA